LVVTTAAPNTKKFAQIEPYEKNRNASIKLYMLEPITPMYLVRENIFDVLMGRRALRKE
jgi:hypothetical protein